MISPTPRQSNLFYVPWARQAVLLKDALLDPVDALLDDADLVGLVHERLARRRPLSPRRGRPSIAPDRLLRCCVMKHLKGWSFRELEREIRSSLVYRRFTRFDADPTPNYSTFSRCFALLGPEVTKQVHERVVAKAREENVARGRKLRTDTTVVASNIHYPTDSSLLGDGVRVLTRALRGIAKQCEAGAVAVVNHDRPLKRRLLEISRSAKVLTEASQQRLKDGYEKILKLTRGVLRQARAVREDLQGGRLPIVGSVVSVMMREEQLRHFVPLLEKVVVQTKERVFLGNRHVKGKVLSLFEPHTQALRKGKAHKPTEFGRLVRVDGVERVALPGRGRLSQARIKRQKQRWFQRALRWRAGIEARISTLKHPFSMVRATYKGEAGFERDGGGGGARSN